MKDWSDIMKTDQSIMLVTGANSGMGKATALAFARLDAHVIMICRNEAKGKEAQQEVIQESGNTKVDLLLCDFSKLEDVNCSTY